jgi:excinuclease ABC subunit B
MERSRQEFRLVNGFKPKGDQPKAIEGLVGGIERGLRDQVLLGVTGSGSKWSLANAAPGQTPSGR